MHFFVVGLGGAFGAVARYSISLIPYKGDFPLLTLVTNLIGALVIGFVTGIATKREWSENTVLFLKTGVCGGFTTFSTFSLESYTLFQTHRPALAIMYMLLSVILCLAGIFIGVFIANKSS